jgi:hypothetical protein
MGDARRESTRAWIRFTEIAWLIAVLRDVTAKFEETKALRQKLRALGDRSR